jgi:hypothetical protein
MAELEVMAEGCPDNLDQSECKEWEANTDKYQDKFKTANLETLLSKMAVGDIPVDVERYVKEVTKSNPDYDEAQVWATAWSIYCKNKNPSSEHCHMNTNEYFKGAMEGLTKLAAGRPLYEIAKEIRSDWKKVYFGAVPYLQAMATMDSIDDDYGDDSAKSIVMYFLSNATSWKGEVAKKVKKELQDMAKHAKSKWGSSDDAFLDLVIAAGEPDNSMKKSPLDPMASWNEGEIDFTDDPREHESEGSMIPGLEDRLASEAKQATEFTTPEALKKYLQDHPTADKSKHHVKKDEGGGKSDAGNGDAKSVNLSREGYKAISDTLQGFSEPGPWGHVVTFANSGKPMEPKHVKQVVDDINKYLKNWNTPGGDAQVGRWTPKDKKDLTRAKGILENSMGKKSSEDDMMAELGRMAEGCPDNLDEGECKEWEANTDKYKDVVKDKHQATDKAAGFSFAERTAYFSFVGNKAPFNMDVIQEIHDLEIDFVDDEGEKHEDNTVVHVAGRPQSSPPLTHSQEMQGMTRETVVQVRFPEGSLKEVNQAMTNLGKRLKFEVTLLPKFREPQTIQGPAAKQPNKKPFPFRASDGSEAMLGEQWARLNSHHAVDDGDAVDADGKAGKFEEGKPADPTKNMSPEDAAEWEKQNKEHADEFKTASLDDKWGNVIEAGAEGRKNPIIPKIKKDDFIRFEQNGKELEGYATKKSGKGWMVEVGDKEHLVTEGDILDWSQMQNRNRTAAQDPSGLYGYTRAIQSSCEGSIRKMAKSALRIAKEAYAKNEDVAPFLAAHAKRSNSLSAKILVAAMKNIGPKIASDMRLAELKADLLPADLLTKQACQYYGTVTEGYRIAARKFGLYGYAAKTASLGLQACTALRETAGQVTADLHGRKADAHNHITGFFKSHSKEAKCMYAKMLCASYPDFDRKTASVISPTTVGEWLTWED